jgi:hypothetical protein
VQRTRRVGLFVLLVGVCGSIGWASTPPAMQFLDDRGEAIGEELELCWFVQLERTCTEIPPGEGHSLPDRFDVLTVEGPRHGPIGLRPGVLVREDEEGPFRIEVPRKARLRLLGLPDRAPVGLSLYEVHDPVFRYPWVHDRVSPEGNWIPAGDLVVSLSATGAAPDLHLVRARPGEELTLRYRRRAGWSLLLRTLDRKSQDAVAGARITLRTTHGYEDTAPSSEVDPDRPVEKALEAKTNGSGLAVFSGLESPLVDAEISHPDFLDTRIPALTAARGTFAFREHALPVGGTVRATVSVEGEPAAGIPWRLLRYRRDAPGSTAPPEVFAEGTTGEAGGLAIDRVPEGPYYLRLDPAADGGVHVDRAVQVLEGEESALQVDLVPIPLDGTVYRDDRGVEGIQIVVLSQDDPKPNAVLADAVANASTDEEGYYRTTLWAPGRYSVHADPPDGTPGGFELISVGGAGRTVDFHFGPHDIEGIVVDEEGRPVGGAHVELAWKAHYYRLGASAEDGTFVFPVEDESGAAELHAQKNGYLPSESVEIRYIPGEMPPRVTLTLRGGNVHPGRLVASDGRPVVGGWVASFRVDGFSTPQILDLVATGENGSFVVPGARQGRTQLFFAGPGCPLGFLDMGPSAGGASPDPGESGLLVTCSALPANLEVRVVDPEGAPMGGSRLLLARGRWVIPREVLGTHLANLGLLSTTDSGGRLIVPALAPGTYTMFLGKGANAFSIAQGLRNGYLGDVQLTPAATSTAEVVVDR